MVHIRFRDTDEVRRVRDALCLTERPGHPEEAEWKSERDRKRDTPHGYPVGLLASASRDAGL